MKGLYFQGPGEPSMEKKKIDVYRHTTPVLRELECGLKRYMRFSLTTTEEKKIRQAESLA